MHFYGDFVVPWLLGMAIGRLPVNAARWLEARDKARGVDDDAL